MVAEGHSRFGIVVEKFAIGGLLAHCCQITLALNLIQMTTMGQAQKQCFETNINEEWEKDEDKDES